MSENVYFLLSIPPSYRRVTITIAYPILRDTAISFNSEEESCTQVPVNYGFILARYLSTVQVDLTDLLCSNCSSAFPSHIFFCQCLLLNNIHAE